MALRGPTRRRDELDQTSSVFTPVGGVVNIREPVLNRDDRRHADSQRHDTHEGERSGLRQRSAGINQITPDIREPVHDARFTLLYKVVCVNSDRSNLPPTPVRPLPIPRPDRDSGAPLQS